MAERADALPGLPWPLLRVLQHRLVAAALIGLLVFAVVAGLRQRGWVEPWELSFYDSLVRLRGDAPSEPVVSMVWIREKEIQELGHPLSDALFVRALEQLLAAGPRAVGIDVYRDRPVGEGWKELAALFRAHPQLVIVEKLAEGDAAVSRPGFLRDASQVGFADLVPDRDGVVRRAALMLWDAQDQHHVSFPFQLAMRFLFAEGITQGQDPERPDSMRLGDTPLPPLEDDFGGYEQVDAGGYQFVMDYGRADGGFPGMGFGDVLEGRFPEELVRDRVVIIGTASPSVKDDFLIPTGASRDRAHRWGAELHAQTVDQLVRLGRGESRLLAALPRSVETLLLLLGCLGGAFVGIRVHSPLSLAALSGLALLVVVGGGTAAFLASWWVPVVPVALGGLGALALSVAYGIQQERADRRKMRGIFDKFLSSKLADNLWENRDIFWHGDRPRPQRASATILLSDLFGYTARSEKAEPAEVMDWLGTYTDCMSELVEQHDGMVHDFLGDGLMASWGLPFPRESETEIDEDARRAVRCALAMGEALERLNAAWSREGRPTARLRVGILTGPVVVGAIGGEERMKYAAVGNTVNTAARLESFDKVGFENEESTFRVLVGQETWERLGDVFVTRCLGDHVLKGRGEPVTIHRVEGLAPPRP